MGGFCKCNIPHFSRLVEKQSTLMKSKEIGMFKVLFPASEHFCQSMISDSSRLVERSGGNERNKEVPEVGWGHSMQIFSFFF